MHDHYLELGSKNDVCIYLSADVKKLSQGTVEKSVYESQCLNFCYLGALSDSTWHKTTELAKLFKHLKHIFPNSKLTIITTSDYVEINSVFKSFNLNDYEIKTTRTITELKTLLSLQDFGLMSYFVPENSLEKKLGSILLSVKAVEYFSAGMPMICNAYCGEIGSLIEQNNLGVTYFPERIAELSANQINAYLNKTVKQNCQDFAIENFDYGVNARRYNDLYKVLFSE